VTKQALAAPERSDQAEDRAGRTNAVTNYSDAQRIEGGTIRGVGWSRRGGVMQIASVDDARIALGRSDGRVWIDAEDASTADLTALAECLELHPLIVEDIVERNQRAKVEFVRDTLHLVMFALQYGAELQRVEIDIVLGKRFLLTSHPRGWDPAGAANIRRLGAEHFLAVGADFMLYAVVDPLVDGYFPVLDRLGEELDDLEDEVIRRPDREVVERLFRVRRELLQVRHTVSPEREVFNQLTNREVGLIARERIIYFRDVYDHLIRINDELDTYRELVAAALETYLSTVNNSLSEVMKRLTAITAILAGIGAVGGIFGMSEAATAFQFQEGIGFWVVAIFCMLLGGVTFAYFRKIGWI
jgi:magnesium transporter